jgi:hypothetical protein
MQLSYAETRLRRFLARLNARELRIRSMAQLSGPDLSRHNSSPHALRWIAMALSAPPDHGVAQLPVRTAGGMAAAFAAALAAFNTARTQPRPDR